MDAVCLLFLLVLVLSALYVKFGQLPLIKATLYGTGAAVIGIITSSALSLTIKIMKPKKLSNLLFTHILVFNFKISLLNLKTQLIFLTSY